MATADDPQTPTTGATAAPGPGRALLFLTALGALSGGWAVFLWRELVRSRSGHTPFCGFGGGDCSALWDGSFATAVHAWTGLPVAGWGVVWGVVAFVLPLWAWASPGSSRHTTLRSAARVNALAGVGAVTLLILVSVFEGSFCQSCILSYLLTVAYAGVALFRLGALPSSRGALVAAGATAVVFLALLYPGLRTPGRSHALESLAEVVEGTATDGEGPLTTDGASLESFLARLPLDQQQILSNALFFHRNSAVELSEEPRSIAFGSPGAPVRITTFNDFLCDHCAELHQILKLMAETLPPASFSAEGRHFPLDGTCNPNFRPPADATGESVRCLAARVELCLEDAPDGQVFAGTLFEHQQELTAERVYELAGPWMSRAELESCVTSSATEDELQADIAYAWQYRPRGTPLVLVNGRQGPAFAPFLYAMVLAEGRADHPAFATLPASGLDG